MNTAFTHYKTSLTYIKPIIHRFIYRNIWRFSSEWLVDEKSLQVYLLVHVDYMYKAQMNSFPGVALYITKTWFLDSEFLYCKEFPLQLIWSPL